MDYTTFMAKFGAVFEHSPWVAEAVFETGGGLLNDAETLADQFESVFLASDPLLQIATLRAHPQLACAMAETSELTVGSASEQTGAGLDRCSAAELAEFRSLNTDYNKKFGFPFIIAVSGLERREILSSFRKRLNNDLPTEYQTALQQTCRIARLRIRNIIGDR